MANTIVRKSYVNIRDEKNAAAAITPGHLVERLAAGTVQVHSTAGGAAEKLFALEDSLQGNGITDAYGIGDNVFLANGVPGEQFQGIAAGTIAVGDFLESNGDGTLAAITTPSAGHIDSAIVGVALEAASAAGYFTFGVI